MAMNSLKQRVYNWKLGGGFKGFWNFHPYLGKMNPFWRSYFLDGLVQPETRKSLEDEHLLLAKALNMYKVEPQKISQKVELWDPYKKGELTPSYPCIEYRPTLYEISRKKGAILGPFLQGFRLNKLLASRSDKKTSTQTLRIREKPQN